MDKISMRLSRALGSGYEYFMSLPLPVLREKVDDYLEVVKEDARK